MSHAGGGMRGEMAVCGLDDASRSYLARHRYVFAEGVIFDACFGPALGTQTNTEYLKAIIDSSTEAEWLKSLFSPVDVPNIPFKMKFETRNYSIIGGN